MAQRKWQDRADIWNAVEEVEKTKASLIACEFIVASPVDLNRDERIGLLTGFI